MLDGRKRFNSLSFIGAAVKRLRRSTVARITLAHLLVLVLTLTSLGAYVYWRVSEQMWRQIDQHIETEVEGLAEQYRQRGLTGMLRIIDERIARVPDRRSIYLVEDAYGNWLIGNISAWPSTTTKDETWLTFELYDRASSAMTAARVRTFHLPSGARLLVGRDVQDIHRTTSLIRQALLAGVLFATLMAGAFGALFSRRAWVRLNEISEASHKVVAGDLRVRVPEHDGISDLDELARNINMMLDEINHLVTGIERVSDNIAHDLRTPLARVRNRLKDLEDKSAQTSTDGIASCRAELDELIGTFNAILRIARLEHHENHDHKMACDLDTLVANCAALYKPLAEDKRIHMRYVGMRAPVVGDEQLINQAICNLLDNAIKFSRANGNVHVTLEARDERYVLTVSDKGVGISECDKDKVLQRFYRGETARRTKGNGLGLSLVNAIAKHHQAELTLADNFPGLRASLSFPRAEAELQEPKKVA